MVAARQFQCTREQVLAYRIGVQQLDREPDARRRLSDASILDFGVQDTGSNAATWSLANRGVPITADGLGSDAGSRELALAWTLRGAPHLYRRSQLPEIRIATSPFSDADAAKRIFDANRPLKQAGIGARVALSEVAGQLRALVTEPLVKGELSTRMTAAMPDPYLRFCRSCHATHLYELPFRIATLYAGLELEPGTSPPVIRPIPGWPAVPPGPADDPSAARPELQPIRAYLHFLGPATHAEVAKFLDAPASEIKARWPADAVEVSIDGDRGSLLDADLPALSNASSQHRVRLLGLSDLYIQTRDRARLVPDAARHKQLWPVLGRPGAILADGEIVGVWRPRTNSGKLSVVTELWTKINKNARTGIDEEAARLAGHRGLVLASVEQS